jgi:hypothetical protein
VAVLLLPAVFSTCTPGQFAGVRTACVPVQFIKVQCSIQWLWCCLPAGVRTICTVGQFAGVCTAYVPAQPLLVQDSSLYL